MKNLRKASVLSEVTHVFFDFAGTLVEGVPNWEHPQIVACAECGVSVTPAQVKAAIWNVWGPIEGCAHPEASVDEQSYAIWIGEIERRILAGLGVTGAGLDAAVHRVTQLQIAPACYRVYPDVEPTLAALQRRGLRLGVVSNFAWQLPNLLHELGLAQYVDVVLTSARVGYRKPRPEIFVQALTQASARAENALYVGDDPECDVKGAQNAGLHALLLDRRHMPAQGQIQTLREVPRRLEIA
ncbi:MAG: HAD family hydrolase [Chloroflexi bacterium]|nr:HAD family hydrolase [Chloroflexota bacterium]